MNINQDWLKDCINMSNINFNYKKDQPIAQFLMPR